MHSHDLFHQGQGKDIECDCFDYSTAALVMWLKQTPLFYVSVRYEYVCEIMLRCFNLHVFSVTVFHH